MGEIRANTVGEINVWPVFYAADEMLADRVLQDVIGLLTSALVVSESMFKEVGLPNNAKLLGGPFFPFADYGPNAFVGGRKGDESVEMVWH